MASDLIPYQEWMKRTAVFGRRRSALLKELDSALELYDQFGGGASRWSVEQKLKAWMAFKDADGGWDKSVRNKNGAITELYNKFGGGEISPAERQALELIKEARQEFLVKLFTGTRLQSNNFVKAGVECVGYAAALGNGIRSATKTETMGRNQDLGRGAFTGHLYSNAWNRVAEVFRGADFEDVLNLPEFISDVSDAIGISLSELSSGMVAGAGLVKSSVKTIWYTYKTGKSGWEVRTANSGADIIQQGDPAAALKALKELIERELAMNSMILGTHAAETGAKAGGMFLDAGAATSVVAGLSGTIARLLINIGYMARDWKETHAANKLLASPETLDASLFQKSPVLGCYFLVCADTSMIVSFLFEDLLLKKSAKRELDRAVTSDLDPVLKLASHALYRHRMRLRGKSLPKLSVVEIKSNASGDASHVKANGQIAMREAGWDDRLTARIINLKNLRGKSDRFY